MKLAEAVKVATNKEFVSVLSYGYMEVSVISSHFEPFKSKRTIKFEIEYYENGSVAGLYNRTFFFEGDELEEDGFFIKDGSIFIDDPDICSRA